MIKDVGLTGLADASSNLLYISANFNMNLSVKVKSSPVAVKRNTGTLRRYQLDNQWLQNTLPAILAGRS